MQCDVQGCSVVCRLPDGSFVDIDRIPDELESKLQQCHKCIKSPKIDQQLRKKLKFNERKLEQLKLQLKILLNIKDVEFIQVLGSGQYGLAALICSSKYNHNLVVKLVMEGTSADDLTREFEIQKQYAALHLAPQVIASKIDSNRQHPVDIIVMAQLTGGILVDFFNTYDLSDDQLLDIANQLINMIDVACRHELTHLDLHFNNVGYNRGGQGPSGITLQFIDFGLSLDACLNPNIDLLALIRGTFLLHDERGDKNAIRLRYLLIDVLKARMGKLPKSNDYEAWNALYYKTINRDPFVASYHGSLSG